VVAEPSNCLLVIAGLVPAVAAVRRRWTKRSQPSRDQAI